jgi:hypothetical protein
MQGKTALYLSGTVENVEKAVAICQTVPCASNAIRPPWANWAFEGVWAGFTVRDGRQMQQGSAVAQGDPRTLSSLSGGRLGNLVRKALANDPFG